jgi:hypothetical protein
MSCILSSVFICHEVLLVSSFSVICRAVSSGIEVNKETTSKEIMISSGSMWMSFIFDRKVLTFLTECVIRLVFTWDSCPVDHTFNHCYIFCVIVKLINKVLMYSPENNDNAHNSTGLKRDA